VAYRVVVIPCDDHDPWGGLLHEELVRLEAEGLTVCAMTTRVAPVVAPIGTPTRYVQQIIVLAYRAGASPPEGPGGAGKEA